MAVKQPQQKEKQPATKAATSKVTDVPQEMIFDKSNYMIMLAGVVVILIGFALMYVPKNTDPNVFPADKIYSFRAITLAPIVVIAGFAIEIFAILKRRKD